MTNYQTLSAPAGRLLISLIFLLSGLSKITAYAGTQGYMEAMGVPGGLLPLVILAEIGLALLIIIGWKTRLAAAALIGFNLLTAVLFHNNLADQIQFIMFMKNISIAGGFFFLVAHGAGAWSVDSYLTQKLTLGEAQRA